MDNTKTDQDRIEEYVRMSRPSVSVVGCGGAGCNVVSWIKEKGVVGAKIIALNTDAAHLSITKADKRILIGENICKGQGAGGYPERGAEAAKESLGLIKRELSGANLVFVTAGLGGGTGTGAAWMVANELRSSGALTIGVVTIPFSVESSRMDKARDGLNKLRQNCDTIIVIDNNNLRKVAGNLPLKQAFAQANELIGSFVKHVTETITTASLVNLDFADLKAIMERGGLSAIGVGEGDGSDRIEKAAKMALTNQLLDIDNIKEAKGALISIVGGEDMSLEEVTRAGEIVSASLSPKARMIWGARVEPEITGTARVMVALTGVECKFLAPPVAAPPPPPLVVKKKGFFGF